MNAAARARARGAVTGLVIGLGILTVAAVSDTQHTVHRPHTVTVDPFTRLNPGSTQGDDGIYCQADTCYCPNTATCVDWQQMLAPNQDLIQLAQISTTNVPDGRCHEDDPCWPVPTITLPGVR